MFLFYIIWEIFCVIKFFVFVKFICLEIRSLGYWRGNFLGNFKYNLFCKFSFGVFMRNLMR